MITHKQFPNHKVYEMMIGGRPFTVETGKVAELADAECVCRYGDTVVLTTVTCSPLPKAGIDYFPLTIEFEERMYSVGRIPGSFNRREGKPSERGILNSRIIDRQALHCFRCRFLHPISGEQIELTAPLDDTFVQALRQSGIQKPDGI